MNPAEIWWYFWCACFVLAGSSFAFIAVVVLVRGVTDLREMLRLLEQKRRQPGLTHFSS